MNVPIDSTTLTYRVLVFCVSGSILWQQQQQGHYYPDQNPDDHHHHPYHTLLHLPTELQEWSLQEEKDNNNNNLRSNTGLLSSPPPPPQQQQQQQQEADPCQDEYNRATLGRTPGLTMDDLERSRALIGNRYRLAQVAQKLQQPHQEQQQPSPDPVTVVVCGGSITLGHGVVPYVLFVVVFE